MKKILTIFISTLFALFLIEVFLIFDDYSKKFEEPYEVEVNKIKYKLNLNVKELNNNRRKIFVVGDSFIQGEFCAFKKKTLPDEIQKINYNYTVLNIGLEGKSLPNYIDLLTTEIKPKKGDKVILFLYDNDIFLSEEMCRLSIIHNNKFGIYEPKMCNEIIDNKIQDKSKNNFLKLINSKVRNFKTVSVLKDALINVSYFKSFFSEQNIINFGLLMKVRKTSILQMLLFLLKIL